MKIEKLLKKVLEKPSRNDIKFSEIEALLVNKGFKKKEGKGSRVKFYNDDKIIILHKPHPGNIVKRYMVEQIQKELEDLIET